MLSLLLLSSFFDFIFDSSVFFSILLFLDISSLSRYCISFFSIFPFPHLSFLISSSSSLLPPLSFPSLASLPPSLASQLTHQSHTLSTTNRTLYLPHHTAPLPHNLQYFPSLLGNREPAHIKGDNVIFPVTKDMKDSAAFLHNIGTAGSKARRLLRME